VRRLNLVLDAAVLRASPALLPKFSAKVILALYIIYPGNSNYKLIYFWITYSTSCRKGKWIT
ncbi:MAG: hypothetical protein KGL95_10565, partial [Patescibacteria group bacterium]|nr:hypothetical protein [Patescibacteria group bacterium]